MDGDDLHRLPLSLRKTNLAWLLRGRPEGIFINRFEQGEVGPDLFRKACEFGLEGLVSKHRERAYRAGRLGIGSRSRTHSRPRWSGLRMCNGRRREKNKLRR